MKVWKVWAAFGTGAAIVALVGLLTWPKPQSVGMCKDQNVGTQTQVPPNSAMPIRVAPPVFTSAAPNAHQQYLDVRAGVQANHDAQVSDHRAAFIAEAKLSPTQVKEYDRLVAVGNDLFRSEVVPVIDAALAAPNDKELQLKAKKTMQDVVVGQDMKLLAMNPFTHNRMGNMLDYENMGKFRQFVIAFAPSTTPAAQMDNVRAALAK